MIDVYIHIHIGIKYCMYIIIYIYMLLAQYCIITIILFRSSFITPPSSFYFSHLTVLHAYLHIIIIITIYDCAHRSFTSVICCTRLVIVFTLSRIIIIIYLRVPMNYKYTSTYVFIIFYNVY